MCRCRYLQGHKKRGSYLQGSTLQLFCLFRIDPSANFWNLSLDYFAYEKAILIPGNIKLQITNSEFCKEFCQHSHRVTKMSEGPNPNDMFPAILKGDIYAIQELIYRYGLSYLREWSNGYTLVCAALRSRRPEIARTLLLSGASVKSDDVSSNTNTSLHCAVTEECSGIVSMLLRRNVDINAVNCYGETALHIAIKKRSPEIVELLIAHKIKMNCLESLEINPILMSLNYGEYEILNKLVNYGIRTNWPGTTEWLDDECTLLHLAVLQQDKTRVEYLLSKGLNVNAKMTDGKTSLHIATIVMNAEIVELLLKYGADIEAQAETNYPQGRSGWTPLFFAYNNTEIANILIANNANVKATDNCGETPLHVWVISSDSSIFNVLIDNGADINARATNGYTPLHSATVVDCDLKIYERLIERGAQIDAKDDAGLTALHLAVTCGSPSVVRFLLDKGADVNATCNANLTPLYYAYERITGDPDIDGDLGISTKMLEQAIITMITRGQDVIQFNRDAVDEYIKAISASKEITEANKSTIEVTRLTMDTSETS